VLLPLCHQSGLRNFIASAKEDFKSLPAVCSVYLIFYSHDDVRRLLEATQSYRRRHTLLEPHTFRAIMILLYGAGLRISEALSLRVSDVDLSHSLLIQKTKFHKSRFVPIGPQVQREMEQFFRARREANHSETPDAPFFIGRKGNRPTGQRCSAIISPPLRVRQNSARGWCSLSAPPA
jgi:integrase/recombinase XerD